MEFAHLHVHSEYSLLDGSARIEDIVNKTKDLGMDSIALTDHGSMFGIIDFYKKAKAAGIKPILGSEVYVTPGDIHDKTPKNRTTYHLVLLAENNTGYKNLMKIVSKGYTDGFYYRPRVDYDTLKKYSEGIIATSACISGEVPMKLRSKDYDGAVEKALFYQDIFGEGNFFLELQDHGMDIQHLLNDELIKLSEDTGIDLIATNDFHYLDKDDHMAHDVLLCIQTGSTLNAENRMKFPSDEFYLKSYDEMYRLFSKVPQAIENTQKIADRCNVDIEFHKTKLPHFDIPEGHTNESYLRYLVEEGLKEQYDELTPEIMERYETEISTIKDMGYIDYFLIVWDFVRFAKESGIPVGPGRGSAAGSLISYALGITGVDPLEYDLLFERFLNPERVSMPDIDIDFCYERREEVIDYVIEKYGQEKVAQIVTFGTMAARGAIRDVGRVLDIPYRRVDEIAKMIPETLNMTLEKALEISKDLKRVYEEDHQIKRLIDIALAVEGLPRHTSTHAAGVLITESEVTDYVPLTRNDDIITTQYNMNELEELGLLKMDFLGLRTLTVVDDALEMIKENHGIDIDIDAIDLEDPKVLELFAKAETIGIFQFESAGMRRFLAELKADRFDNLIAANSLFRPGPMDQIPQFVERKHDPSKISFVHPMLEEILEPTYGIIVYQEQVMQIFQDIGGYSLGQADIVRRAMGKMQMDVMMRERDIFIYGETDEDGNIITSGAVRNGVDEKTAEKIFDLMLTFANYAFNKSHSVSYARVAMETAYLKTYYPAEFMAALMSSVVNQSSQLILYLEETKRLGIEILRPDVNRSFKKFSVEDGNIRYGMLGIKGLGSQAIDGIVGARRDGEFTDLRNFITRVLDYKRGSLNKRAIESLIRSGALDNIIPARSKAIAAYEDILTSHTQDQRRNVAGQVNIFGDLVEEDVSEISYPNVPEFSAKDKYEMEKESTGVYLTGHPLEEYKKEIEEINELSTTDIYLQDRSNPGGIYDNMALRLAGMVNKVNRQLTRKNDIMAFVQLEDLLDSIELIVFPQAYEKYQDILKEGAVLVIDGRLSISDAEEPKIIANSIKTIEEAQTGTGEKLYLKLTTREDEEFFQNVASVLVKYPGTDQVIFYFDHEKSSASSPKYSVDLRRHQYLVEDLEGYLSNGDILIKE